MARAQATDFLHNMRFHVEVTSPQNGPPGWLSTIGRTNGNTDPAGFATCSLPDATVQAVQYKEGTMIYHRKYPGDVSMGAPISLTRGVARNDSSFWLWLRCIIEGSGEYRADMQIKHFHRETALTRPYNDLNQGPDKLPNTIKLDVNKPARTYHVHEVFPIEHNVAGSGLDAASGDVSIMGIQCEYEYFEVQEHAAT